MPIGLNPNKTTWFPLDSDKDLAPESRPEFQCRFITCEQSDKIEELINRAVKETDAEASKTIDEAIAIGVVGWRNMPDPGDPNAPHLSFSIQNLSRVLTITEKFELAGKQRTETSLQEYELKKASRSQSGSSTEKAASTTVAASA